MSVTAFALKARDKPDGERGECGGFLLGDFLVVVVDDDGDVVVIVLVDEVV